MTYFNATELSTPHSNTNETLERYDDRPAQKERGGSLFAKSFGLPKSNKVEVEVVPPNGDGIDNDYGYNQNAEQGHGARDNALQ